jgi:nicotinamide riboside kinase
MTDKKTTIINLYGGPGSGKSTSAAYLYYLLKSEGKNVELVREYVKDWAYEARLISNYDQIYFLGKQVRRESLLYGKVDWIITDSPVMMNLYYAQKYCPSQLSEGIRAATLSMYRQAVEDGHKHTHIFLKRIKPYLAEGRYQKEEEAKEIDVELKQLLQNLKVPFIEIPASEEELKKTLTQIKEEP